MSLLNEDYPPEVGVEVLQEVLDTLTLLLAGSDGAKAAFAQLVRTHF